jgi:hypothetical protein
MSLINNTIDNLISKINIEELNDPEKKIFDKIKASPDAKKYTIENLNYLHSIIKIDDVKNYNRYDENYNRYDELDIKPKQLLYEGIYRVQGGIKSRSIRRKNSKKTNKRQKKQKHRKSQKRR